MLSLMAAGVCLYIAGNFLNDWMDQEWDRQHRPERALPRGLFTSGTYLALAAMFAGVGISLAFSTHRIAGITAFLILCFIVIYTLWHKYSPWLVIPMGLCRALLPIMGAVGMLSGPLDSNNQTKAIIVASLAGGALFFYIVGLSLSARGESIPHRSNFPKILSFGCFTITAIMVVPMFYHSQISGGWWLAPVPYLVWCCICQTNFRRPISRYVSGLLAGIPLVDCITLIPLALFSSIPASPLFLIVSLTLPPLAVISALALQRLAPAT